LQFRYGGLLLRIIAGLADIGVIWLFAWLASVLLGLPFLAVTEDHLVDPSRVHMLITIFLFFAWLYAAGLESSRLQATLGMAIMGIYVTDMAGERAGIGRTTIRFWMRFLSLAPMGSGFLPILLTKRRQSVHDMFAGCVVLKR
jgi:uncharacterized RDD family membrane protein YckC